MSQHELMSSILKQIKEIENLFLRMSSYSGKISGTETIPKVEMDLAFSKIQYLYNNLLGLERTGIDKPEQAETINKTQTPGKKGRQKKEPVIEKDRVPIPNPVQEEKLQQDDSPVTIENTPEQPNPDPAQKPTIEDPVLFDFTKDIPFQTKEKKDQPPEPAKQKKILAETFQGTKSMHDKLSEQAKEEDLSTRLSHKPVSDIRTAIGINEKFRFVQVLFQGDVSKYSQTVEQLNNLNNLDEAKALLNHSLAGDPENETYKNFIDIVYRRFIKQ